MALKRSKRIDVPWRYPLFDLDYGPEEERAVIEVIRSGWITQGPTTEEYERELARYFGSKYAVATSSGTTALHLAYIAAGIKRGSKVIVPSLTFVATVSPLIWIGAIPIFVDIHSLKYPNLDPEEVEKHAKDADAIVFVHYAGYTKFIEEIKEIAERYSLTLIEDASHAIGSRIGDRFAGTFGAAGAFSTFTNKNLSTGEGGFILTNDEKTYEKAKLLRSYGLTTSSYSKYTRGDTVYDVVEIGFNYRPTEITAALGLTQLKKLEEKNRKRVELVRAYREFLGEDFLIPFDDYESSANYIFPVVLPEGLNRNEVAKRLGEAGIQTSVHYPPVHKFTAFKDFDVNLPKTEEFSERELTLPLYPSLEVNDIKVISEELKRATNLINFQR